MIVLVALTLLVPSKVIGNLSYISFVVSHEETRLYLARDNAQYKDYNALTSSASRLANSCGVMVG